MVFTSYLFTYFDGIFYLNQLFNNFLSMGYILYCPLVISDLMVWWVYVKDVLCEILAFGSSLLFIGLL